MNILFGNYNGNYKSMTYKEREEEVKGYQMIGYFCSIEEKLELISYFETMYLEDHYGTDLSYRNKGELEDE